MANKTELTPAIKNWFGDGEIDVDLMIRMGAVTPEQILSLWNREKSMMTEHD